MIGVRRLRFFWHDERGTAVVEGAVVLPVLMTLMFGTYEFAWYFYQQQLITTGIHDAARYLARVYDPTNTTSQTNAKNIATSGYTTVVCASASTCRVTGWTASNINIVVNSNTNSGSSTPCGTSACFGGTNGTIQVVVVSTSFADPSLGFFRFLGLSTPTINVSHSERVMNDSAQ